ncbi:MAG: ATPase P, partial [Methanomicrobiales archaeon]|nr:ATPase P [Methanomicrobiales archaeon]
MFHSLSIQRALEELHSTPAGLSEGEVRERLVRYGPNTLVKQKRKSLILLFAGQFTDILIVILAIAAIISGFLQEWLDAYAILVIILLNGAIGF